MSLAKVPFCSIPAPRIEDPASTHPSTVYLGHLPICWASQLGHLLRQSLFILNFRTAFYQFFWLVGTETWVLNPRDGSSHWWATSLGLCEGELKEDWHLWSCEGKPDALQVLVLFIALWLFTVLASSYHFSFLITFLSLLNFASCEVKAGDLN